MSSADLDSEAGNTLNATTVAVRVGRQLAAPPILQLIDVALELYWVVVFTYICKMHEHHL